MEYYIAHSRFLRGWRFMWRMRLQLKNTAQMHRSFQSTSRKPAESLERKKKKKKGGKAGNSTAQETSPAMISTTCSCFIVFSDGIMARSRQLIRSRSNLGGGGEHTTSGAVIGGRAGCTVCGRKLQWHPRHSCPCQHLPLISEMHRVSSARIARI